MSYHDFITLISSLLGSGGLLGGLYLFMKFRPEAGMMVVKSAEGVVVMQANYIKKLEERIDQLEKQVGELTKELADASILLKGFQATQERHDREVHDLQNPKI